ncbi:MAG: cytochrome b/b6 domain-containing protein [Fimbriimonadaceae bacterium]|nr:cytochrome b/b6 domain-containing protein [Fimbriimonadaceae bacterium]QYK55059.1 MAG: cytochrome b/b6 domain-containing protein [Fimbriimonadaceae bacterium]
MAISAGKARPAALLVFACVPLLVALVFGQEQANVQTKTVEQSEENKACLSCHDPKAEVGPAMHLEALAASPHRELDCTNCHSLFKADESHSEEARKSTPACADCHSEEADLWASSVHARPDKRPGDHPTCVRCHSYSDPHGIVPLVNLPKRDRIENCGTCHRSEEPMGRYGPSLDAVHSYELSFHGKAFLKFGELHTAVCTDCHGYHDVKHSTDPTSRTFRANLPKTCGQANCHPGAQMNFAASGANHMYLTINQKPILAGLEMFFKVLTFTVITLLSTGIILDLRRAIAAKEPPPTGRPVAILISLGFLTLVVAIVLGALGQASGLLATIVAFALAGLALYSHLQRRKKTHVEVEGRKFVRMDKSQRIQHGILVVSFSLLIITGLPIRFPENDLLTAFYNALGGMPVLRVVHRVAGVVLIISWLYHILDLMVRWKRNGFKASAMTMMPRKKDLEDVAGTIRYHLGISPEPPKYERYNFREKFEYLAVGWGTPIMIVTGLILWYPVYFSQFFPDTGIPIAYIAHSYEPVLSLLTIVTWHLYNTHFNPHHFPMNPVWLKGTLTEEEMRAEHPLELERILAAEGPQSQGTAMVEPEPPGTPPEAEQEADQKGGNDVEQGSKEPPTETPEPDLS